MDVDGYISLLKENCISVPEEDEDVKVDISKLKTAKQGDVVVFGAFEQDNDFVNGKEPIEWRVLKNDGSKVLLVSKYVLDIGNYNTDGDSSSWEKCSLRAWLNNDFYNTAFTKGEQLRISETELKNNDNPDSGAEGGNDTIDKVFILSIDDVTNPEYGFSADIKEYDKNRNSAPSAYAETKGPTKGKEPKDQFLTIEGEGACDYWLRTVGNITQNAATLTCYGAVFANGYFINWYYGIRPAITVDIS